MKIFHWFYSNSYVLVVHGGGEFESCCKMLQIVAHVLPELPWLFMKSTFNKAGYGLAWTVLNVFLFSLLLYYIWCGSMPKRCTCCVYVCICTIINKVHDDICSEYIFYVNAWASLHSQKMDLITFLRSNTDRFLQVVSTSGCVSGLCEAGSCSAGFF